MVVVLAASVGFAQDKKDDKKPAKLDGKYLLVGIEINGEKLPAEFFDKTPEADRTVVIKDDKLLVTRGKKEQSITLKLDPSKKPAHITTTETKDGKTETMIGIYKLEGDTLTICGVDNGKDEDRPREFKTEKGSKVMMLTLKKKDK
jgi:uncharacterized protein (TIGR03067 family)